MSAKVNIITDSAKLDQAIVKINQSANGLIAMIQLGLASAVYQTMAHGNTNHINALVKAVGKGVRKQAIAQWLLKWAPVVLETDKAKMAENPFRFSQERMDAIAEANEVTLNRSKKFEGEAAQAYAQALHDGEDWSEHKEPPLVPTEWDAAAALQKLLQTAKSMQTRKVNIKHADILGRLVDLLPKKEAEVAQL